jgi:hypothetical protein
MTNQDQLTIHTSRHGEMHDIIGQVAQVVQVSGMAGTIHGNRTERPFTLLTWKP